MYDADVQCCIQTVARIELIFRYTGFPKLYCKNFP